MNDNSIGCGLGLILIALLIGGWFWLDSVAETRCHDLLHEARTHADTLVVYTAAPVGSSSFTCYQVAR